METRINFHIRGIFMLDERPIPPALMKHLTNKIFNKPNKEAMEQVLYYLLPIINKNCLKSLPWPISTLKEAAEFRNAATLIINGLDGFVYKKSSKVAKVNSSLLANPGGSMFVLFMYQFCLYIICYQLKKKGIFVLNAPLLVEDEYTPNKNSMFARISNSNFNEVNEIISRVDCTLCSIAKSVIKWKEIIQDSKQYIKYLKSESTVDENCEATENEYLVLKQKYINLYNNFEQNKLMAMKCTKLADIVLKTPETLDAHMINSIFSINKEEFMRHDGKVDLVNLLKFIKNTLNNYINWCEKLYSEEKVNNKILEVQQSAIVMTEQMQCYEKTTICQNTIITSLENENYKLNKDVFTSKTFENIDFRIQSVYKKTDPIIFNTTFCDKSISSISEYNKKTRRSISIPCISKSCYNYQTLPYDNIKEVYKATSYHHNRMGPYDDINVNKRHISISHAENQDTQIALSQRPEHLQNFTHDDSNNQLTLPAHHEKINRIKSLNNSCQIQAKEDEVKSVSISRKSIENIKQKLIKIKTQSQAMSTIPHSPQSPF